MASILGTWIPAHQIESSLIVINHEDDNADVGGISGLSMQCAWAVCSAQTCVQGLQ